MSSYYVYTKKDEKRGSDLKMENCNQLDKWGLGKFINYFKGWDKCKNSTANPASFLKYVWPFWEIMN